jgi:hypothetical protein
MNKPIQVKLTRPPDEIIAQAREAATSHGIRFAGDEQTGHFEGHGIEGSYWIMDEVLSIRILKKPFILPWSLIEMKVRDYFASG